MTSRKATLAGKVAPAPDGAGLAYLLLAQEVHEFLCAEADLLDERRYEEWLELLTDDVSYWAPMRRNVQFGHWDTENTRQGRDMNWFDEGKSTLRLRIKQITSGVHWVEEPAPRVSRLITNVHGLRATPSLEEPEEVSVKYRVLIYRNKLEDSTDVFAGKRDDVLRKVDGRWKICKRVMLLDQSVLLSATMPFVL
ncbi:MAG: 3-phenylpropionate/cinnamic acid dioxygenase subunit beta [Deltaproteobacteria bacterium]|nr:3-phenylpropionate/cinnamic acid dioxygenase subunit beta [Deltaproteobacteria bacterium]